MNTIQLVGGAEETQSSNWFLNLVALTSQFVLRQVLFDFGVIVKICLFEDLKFDHVFLCNTASELLTVSSSETLRFASI